MSGKPENSSRPAKRRATSSTRNRDTAAGRSSNYFAPLQTVVNDDEADDIETDEGAESNQTARPKPPPINVIKSNSQTVLQTLTDAKIEDYIIKRMSIGIKILSSSMETFDKICGKLKESNCEYYTHSIKSELPFKAVLSGLESVELDSLKSYLISAGVKCLDIKPITRKTKAGLINLFMVYITRGSITLRELREKCYVINKTIVRWEFHRRLPKAITQCYNCQMFGHGSKHCNIKTFCANCSGPHPTSQCNNPNIVKCANCHGAHKSTEKSCPSRLNYVQFREKFATKKPQSSPPTRGFVPRKNDFPSLTSGNTNQPSATNVAWSSFRFNNSPKETVTNSTNGNNPNLFSLHEIQMITTELVSKLRLCKDKHEQFNVITELAIKYLSNGP